MAAEHKGELVVADPLASHHAILIGINAYSQKPLRGCVEDVRALEQHLNALPFPVKIHKLVAHTATDVGVAGPDHVRALWPTRSNLQSVIEDVITSASSGDAVYVHFSGHGVRPRGEHGLALLAVDEKGESEHLPGIEFALLLQRMVRRGLTVSVVLDCCFSGSFHRDSDVLGRFLLADGEDDVEQSSLTPQGGVKSAPNWRGRGTAASEWRDASMLPNWIVDPQGYTLLSACGPREIARELQVSEKFHGVLSYFLIRAIADYGAIRSSSQKLWHHVRGSVSRYERRQNPVFFGGADLQFFSTVRTISGSAYSSVVELTRGVFQLQAGQAHGVSNGDVFALSPLRSEVPCSPVQTPTFSAVVVTARAFDSDLRLCDTQSARSGWIARPLSSKHVRSFPVQLATSIHIDDHWMDALQVRSLEHCGDISSAEKAGAVITFHISLDERERYVISGTCYEEIPHLPEMSISSSKPEDVCSILEHLIRYKIVENISGPRQPNPSFGCRFSAKVLDRSGTSYPPGSQIHVRLDHDVDYHLTLVVETFGDKEIYIAVYDMGSRWQIVNVLQASWEVICAADSQAEDPGLFKKKITMCVPATLMEQGYRKCDDIIKVFITSRPVSFDLLTLPVLGSDTETHEIEAVRATYDINVADDWIAFNFHIKTSLD